MIWNDGKYASGETDRRMLGLRRVIGGLAHGMRNVFPEREFHYRARGRVRYFTISRGTQFGLAFLFAVFVGWSVFATFYFVTFDRVMRNKGLEIAQAHRSQRDLLAEVGRFNARLQKLTVSLEKSRSELMRLAGRDGTMLSTGMAKSGTSKEAQERAKRSRAELETQIKVLSKRWGELNKRSASIETGVKTIGSDVETILARHSSVKKQRDLLLEQVAGLRRELSGMRRDQDELVTSLDKRTVRSIEDVEKVVAMTGLDVDKLVAQMSPSGQGGPVNEITAASATDTLSVKVARLQARAERWKDLQKIVRNLPLIAPLDHYRKASGYGARRDPFTGRWSRHNGLDFAYHINTPILSTAPGTVVYAGWRGGYGWFIEIDHGMGIRTRYAHLKKILITKGQKVGFREKIGLLGTSGRSTGPHVHYEIVVDGKPNNPMKFITAGKYVFKG